jgi:hypothetical protein
VGEMKCPICGRNIAREHGIDTCEVKCSCNEKEMNFNMDDAPKVKIEPELQPTSAIPIIFPMSDDEEKVMAGGIVYDCKKYGHKWKKDYEIKTKVLYRKICLECSYIVFNSNFEEEYDAKKGKVK